MIDAGSGWFADRRRRQRRPMAVTQTPIIRCIGRSRDRCRSRGV